MDGQVVVRTALGSIAGSTIDTEHGPVHRFAGVPFGAPPVAGERFRAARPAQPWTGTISAESFGPAPMQALAGPLSGAVPGMTVESMSEDCLALNIWRPAADRDQPRPVLVWIYGGAFVIGGSSLPTYDGARLAAEQDVVVVSVNYRVGALGFLDLRSVPGGETADTNCGLHDLVLALEWIRRSIGDFGGAPERVTVFGESAGAGAIVHLLTTPDVGKLIVGAVAHSPGIDFTQHEDLSATVTKAFMRRAGATTVDQLRALSAEHIVEIQEAVAAELMFEVGTMVFHPVVDGSFVPATPSVAIAGGAAADVALLIGYTADEMRLFPDPRADDLDAAGLATWVRAYLTSRMGRDPGDDVARHLVDAQIGWSSASSRTRGSDIWAAIQTDGVIRQPVIRLADCRAEASTAATFVYQFDWESRRADADHGAFHAIDLPFVFDTFDVGGWGEYIGADDSARRLGRSIRSAWASFAANADPSCAALGPWPRYQPATRSTMVLDESPRVIDDPLAAQRNCWHDLWDPACRPAGVPS
jgi:para-nitrobenzyl esterase